MISPVRGRVRLITENATNADLADLLRIVIGSPAAPSRFGILNNLPFTFNVPWTPYQGVLSDGFGSGSSPAPYVVDPLTGFVIRGLQEERPINIDGYYSECVFRHLTV